MARAHAALPGRPRRRDALGRRRDDHQRVEALESAKASPPKAPRRSSPCSNPSYAATPSTSARTTSTSTPSRPRRTPSGRSLSADRLAGLSPAAGHLVHMPAHIYMRIGDYERAAARRTSGRRRPTRSISTAAACAASTRPATTATTCTSSPPRTACRGATPMRSKAARRLEANVRPYLEGDPRRSRASCRRGVAHHRALRPLGRRAEGAESPPPRCPSRARSGTGRAAWRYAGTGKTARGRGRAEDLHRGRAAIPAETSYGAEHRRARSSRSPSTSSTRASPPRAATARRPSSSCDRPSRPRTRSPTTSRPAGITRSRANLWAARSCSTGSTPRPSASFAKTSAATGATAARSSASPRASRRRARRARPNSSAASSSARGRTPTRGCASKTFEDGRSAFVMGVGAGLVPARASW